MTSDGEGSPSGGDGRGIVRRRLLQLVGGATAALGLTGGAAGRPDNGGSGGRGDGKAESGGDGGRGASQRIKRRLRNEFDRRRRNARRQFRRADDSAHASNGRVSGDAVVAKFGKSLPHEDATGLPTTDGFERLVAAAESGEGYDDIRQADLSEADDIEKSRLVDGELNPKPLVQPETAWTYLSEGASTADLRIAVPPAFDDPETGAEMIELYWRALTRDVNFHDYGDDPLVAAAAAELDALDAYNGPGADGTVDPTNVFRGVTPGATTGPYVSQFLWKDRPLGGGVEDQRLQVQTAGSDYMTTVEDWLKVQKGVVPPIDDRLPGNDYAETPRYIVTGRDMCERVHDDPPFRQLQKAAQVLVFGMNAPLDEGIPYTLKPFDKHSPSRRDVDSFTAQTRLPFNDFGPLYIEKKVLEATEHGQKAAWHKKWNVHRRLRPEEYGGRVQAVKGDGQELTSPSGVNYRELIPDNLLDSEALKETKEEFDSYLLPQAYAEGSPTHPSYPAGHSVVAGAGATVLKALFDGDYEFPEDEKVVPTRDGSDLRTAEETAAMGVDEPLTVRGELNKLASNMALGRNRAGIHYRTDGIEGLRLGERAAIRFLEDQLTLPSRIDGVTLTLETFDGETVTVEPGG